MQKKQDLWKCQNESDEARRLRSSGNLRRMKKEADTQDLLSFDSCRSSAVDHVEQMSLESPRKMQDEQEMMGETSGNATRGRGEDGWWLESEGETETLETTVFFWNGAEGVPGYFDGEGHHEWEQSEMFQKGKRSAR